MIDSPVSTLLKQLIAFDKKIPQPLYIQVSQQIANVIQRGYVTKGTKLPGTRALG
ncbi:MAG: GntR family transcriptional regulator/MocR family aminotransferase, partial [Polaribacter sp.]